MAVVSFQTTIARTADDIFDLLADIRRNHEWSPGFMGAQKLTSGPIGAGTSFRTTAKGIGEVAIRIERYERPTHLGFIGTSRRAVMHHEFTFRSGASGTEVDQRIGVQPSGVLRVMAPLMAVMLKRQIQRNTAHLKQYLEQRRSGASSPPSS